MPDCNFNCIVCSGHSGDAYYLHCRDYYLGTPYPVDYWKCQTCGLVQQNPIPEDTSVFYVRYPVHAKKSNWSNALRRLLMAGSYYPAKHSATTRKLLDFGCGDGWFLESCTGKNYALWGFEPDPAHARSVSALIGVPIESDIQQLKEKHADSFDTVTMNFVVEHLTDLDQTFSDVHELLKPGGEFHFSVPNLESTEARLFGRKWHGLDPPRHISFPGESIVRRLADRHGFELVRAHNVGFPPGLAGSIPTALTGKFRYPLFMISMPLALVAGYLWPQSARAYFLRKAT